MEKARKVTFCNILTVVGTLASISFILFLLMASDTVILTEDESCTEIDHEPEPEPVFAKKVEPQFGSSPFEFQYSLTFTINNPNSGILFCPLCPDWMRAFVQIKYQEGVNDVQVYKDNCVLEKSRVRVQGILTGSETSEGFELKHITETTLNPNSTTWNEMTGIEGGSGMILQMEKLVNSSHILEASCKIEKEAGNLSRDFAACVCSTHKTYNPLQFLESSIIGADQLNENKTTEIGDNGILKVATTTVINSGGGGFRAMQQLLLDLEEERKSVCQCPKLGEEVILDPLCVIAESRVYFRDFFQKRFLCYDNLFL